MWFLMFHKTVLILAVIIIIVAFLPTSQYSLRKCSWNQFMKKNPNIFSSEMDVRNVNFTALLFVLV